MNVIRSALGWFVEAAVIAIAGVIALALLAFLLHRAYKHASVWRERYVVEKWRRDVERARAQKGHV